MNKLLFIFILTINISLNAQTLPELDTSFNIGTGFNGNPSYPPTVGAIKLQDDNKIIIGGHDLSSFNGTSISSFVNIIRINNDGSFDIPFSTSSFVLTKINTIDVQQDGKIIVAGNASSNSGRIKRFLSDGNLDTSFSTGTSPSKGFNNEIRKVLIQNDGKILVNGSFNNFSTSTIKNLARLTTTGNLDINFKNNIDAINQISTINDFELLPTQKIILTSNSKIFLLNSDGSLDSSFNSTSINNAEKIYIQSDGKYLVSKNISNNYNELIRVNIDGTIDNTFTQYPFYDTQIKSIKQFIDGSIFINIFGTMASSKRLIKLDPLGNLDINFDIDGIDLQGGAINSFELQPNGNILIGGDFTYYNGTTKRNILRLSNNNSLSLNEIEKKNISIYPNPAVKNITVQLNKDFNYEIHNILGVKISKGRVTDNQIDIEELSSGTYILKIITDGSSINKKFIKQ